MFDGLTSQLEIAEPSTSLPQFVEANDDLKFELGHQVGTTPCD